MNAYIISYTCLDAWINHQRTETKFCEVVAQNEQSAIEWFEDNIQSSYDDIELVETV